jgi:hypothetical protein
MSMFVQTTISSVFAEVLLLLILASLLLCVSAVLAAEITIRGVAVKNVPRAYSVIFFIFCILILSFGCFAEWQQGRFGNGWLRNPDGTCAVYSGQYRFQFNTNGDIAVYDQAGNFMTLIPRGTGVTK